MRVDDQRDHALDVRPDRGREVLVVGVRAEDRPNERGVGERRPERDDAVGGGGE